MSQINRRRVIFANIARTGGQSNIFEGDFAHDIEAALDPHLHIERYGRTWRVSRTTKVNDSFLVGKFGFQHTASREEVFFDDEKEDFVTELKPAEQGNFSHFAISLDKGLMLFEERKPDIKPQSFIGALKKLFRETDYNFEVTALPREQAFIEWKGTVDRIIAFSGTAERPNPQWRPRTEKIHELIESTNADKIDIDAKIEDENGQGKSLNIDDPILDGIVEHANTDYGKFKAIGISAGTKRIYNSEEDYIATDIDESPEDISETIFNRLISAMKDKLYRND